MSKTVIKYDGPIFELKLDGITVDLTGATVVVRDNGEIIEHKVASATAGLITFALGEGKHEIQFEISSPKEIRGVKPHGWVDQQLSREGKELRPTTEFLANCANKLDSMDNKGDRGIPRMTPHSEVERGQSDAEFEAKIADNKILENIKEAAKILNEHEDARIKAGSNCRYFDAVIGPCGHITCEACHPGNLAKHDACMPILVPAAEMCEREPGDGPCSLCETALFEIIERNPATWNGCWCDYCVAHKDTGIGGDFSLALLRNDHDDA